MKVAVCVVAGLALLGSAVRTVEDFTEEEASAQVLASEAGAESQASAGEKWLLASEKCRVKGSLRSGFGRRSCRTSWSKGGRCAWVSEDDGCMTNCKHPKNRDQTLCDPTDCIWRAAEGSCSFADSSTSGRTDYCLKVSGILKKDQLSFCDGVPTAPVSLEVQPMARAIDIMGFMGCWYVQANIPTFLDKGSSNNIELYEWNAAKKRIDVTFQYTKGGKDVLSYQKGWLVNDEATLWRLHPRLLWVYWPFNLPYVLTYVAEDFSSSIVGYPDRSYLWIMTREVHPNATEVERLIGIAESQGYKRENMNMVTNDIPEKPAICP